MIKKIFIISVLILGFITIGSITKTYAGCVAVGTTVFFDVDNQEVGGISETYLSYDIAYYYDAGAEGVLSYTDPLDIIDEDFGEGIDDTYVDIVCGIMYGIEVDYTTNDYRPNKILCADTFHYARLISTPIPFSSEPYYDPYGFSLKPPETYENWNVFEASGPSEIYSASNIEPIRFTYACIRTPTVASVTFETIHSNVTNDNPANLGGGSRIFPGRQTLAQNEPDRKIVKIKAQLADSGGSPTYTSGAKVYFRNFDVDDPSTDPIIDNNGTSGGDNRALVNPAGTFSNCVATSNGCYDETDSNGVAEATFTVTMSPGDNFVIAASTDDSYLTGVSTNGTGLKDSGNQSLPTARAKRTNLLSVWRKVHLEVDSMTTVGNNVVNGRVQDPVTVGSTPVWVDISAFIGDLEPSRFQGGQMTSGTYRFEVLDNTEDQVRIQYNSGNATLFYNALFQLFDDDDFNDSDSSPPVGDGTLDGDDGENVTYRCPIPTSCNKFSETFSRLQPSTDVALNPFAAAYIEPDYTWAEGQSGMNDENVPFEINVQFNPPFFSAEREITNRDRDSTGMEQDDFWIGYILIGYQWGIDSLDGDPGMLDDPNADNFGFGFSVADKGVTNAFTNYASSPSDVPDGGIGQLIFIETMRDGFFSQGVDSLIRTVPHELGHQFGLQGDSIIIDWGLMNVTGQSLLLEPDHINVLRYRVSSPGLPF